MKPETMYWFKTKAKCLYKGYEGTPFEISAPFQYGKIIIISFVINKVWGLVYLVGIDGVGIEEEVGAELRGELKFKIEGFVNVRLETELRYFFYAIP